MFLPTVPFPMTWPRVHAHTHTHRNMKRKCGLLWYYHVPKNGGGSYLKYLQNKKKRREIVDLFDLNHITTNRLNLILQEISAFAKNPHGRLAAVHHHHTGLGLVELEPIVRQYVLQLKTHGCDLFMATTLRDPCNRTLSALNFNNEALTPESLKKWQVDLFTTISYDNPQIRYLLENQLTRNHSIPLGDVNQTALDKALTLLKSFAVVGRTEEYAAFVRRVEDVVVFSRDAPPHVHKMPLHKKAAMGIHMPDTMRQQIRENNFWDDKLVAHFPVISS